MSRGVVVAAMSGGVDSSVAAALLKEQGYEVIGVTMNLWPEDEPGVVQERGGCCGLGAVFDARAVADRLGIPYYVLNFRDIFETQVIDRFVADYARGRTPNPCLACNRYIKFDALLHKARQMGADYVATGHYARVDRDPLTGRYRLRRAVDARKDQSYALYALTQDQLAQTLLPLGGFTKPEVRRMAAERGLFVANKPDSQEICFVASGRYTEVVQERAPQGMTPGPILDLDGREVGRHFGLAAYTIGQRRRLGIHADRPLYVVALDPQRNAVIVGPEEALYCEGLVAEDLNWIAWPELTEPVPVEAKIRYNGQPVRGVIHPQEDGRVRMVFDEPARSVTPGQAVVFYRGDEVVGGGTIEAPLRGAGHPLERLAAAH
ncbi:MAG: tRNA 2-thiouridine(34) synthase MnmA [Clostridia bacterium]|nr:tRNA 2-thiouridine(34) synthase MnmA [Clostridia bacterium]